MDNEPNRAGESVPGLERAGRTLGRSAARIARAAKASAPRAGDLAKTSRDGAQPYLAQAVRYLRDHQAEIKQAGAAGARIAATRTASPLLQPVLGAVVDELTKRPPVPMRDPNTGRQQQEESPADASPEDPPRNFF